MNLDRSAARERTAESWATTIGDVCDRFGGDVQTGPFGSQLHAYLLDMRVQARNGSDAAYSDVFNGARSLLPAKRPHRMPSIW